MSKACLKAVAVVFERLSNSPPPTIPKYNTKGALVAFSRELETMQQQEASPPFGQQRDEAIMNAYLLSLTPAERRDVINESWQTARAVLASPSRGSPPEARKIIHLSFLLIAHAESIAGGPDEQRGRTWRGQRVKEMYAKLHQDGFAHMTF